MKDTSAIRHLKDTVVIKQQMVQYKEMAKNPFTFGAITFTEPLPIGIVLTVVCAAILRKSPPAESQFIEAEEVKDEPPAVE